MRSRELALNGEPVFTTPALSHFLKKPISKEALMNQDHHLEMFASLDDTDIMAAVKVWATHPDIVLSKLCRNLVHRELYKVDITNKAPDKKFIAKLTELVVKKYGMHSTRSLVFCF